MHSPTDARPPGDPGANRAADNLAPATAASPNSPTDFKTPASDPASPIGATATPPAITFGQVLAHRHYRNILFAQFVSNLGTWTEAFLLQLWVAKVTGRMDDQGALAAAQSLPIAVLGLLGGVVADRVNRRTLLFVTQLLAGLVAIAVVVVSIVFAGVNSNEDPGARTLVGWIMALGAVNGAVMAFNFPAWQVLTPRLVPRDHLSRAIALNGIQFNLARMLGPAAAGFLVAQLTLFTDKPYTPLLAFNALSFFLMAWVVLSTPDSPAPPNDGQPVWSQIRDARRFILSNRGPLAVFAAQVIISFLAAPLVRLLSLYVLSVYKLDAKRATEAAGMLLALQGLGAVIGGLALRWIPPWYPKHHFIPVAVLGLGATLALFATTTSLWAGYAVMLVCGFFWIWAFNQSWAAMQLLAPDAMRGRVLAITTVASFGATAIGAFLAGAAGEFLKSSGLLSPGAATQAVVAGLGLPLILAGIVMLMFRTPEVDGHPRLPAGRRPSRNVIRAILAVEHWPRSPG